MSSNKEEEEEASSEMDSSSEVVVASSSTLLLPGPPVSGPIPFPGQDGVQTDQSDDLHHQLCPLQHSFSLLSESTDLKLPPRNWLLYPVNGSAEFSATHHYTGFSSFRMASHFLDFLKEVDVVADAENIKKLLKISYAKASSLSLLVHRVGKTLLIDEFDIHGLLLKAEDQEWQRWMRTFLVETVLASKRALNRRNTTKSAIQERNLVSKFLYHSIENDRPAPCDDGDPNEQAFAGSDPPLPVVVCSPPTVRGGESSSSVQQYLPEPPREEHILPDPDTTSHDFARNLLWVFEDLRMLIGSDMPIFGDKDHPSVSLRLHNSKKPINILTGLDYWLDNLMCQVPSVLMCYHIDGIVQRYELIKTEELPNLEGCKFSPKVVRDVAKNILAFLKSNAAKEGHTYWLFKGKDDEVVKLYDLTGLCEDAEEKKATEETGRDDLQNPFRTAVAMLMYKVAKNMFQTGESAKAPNTARQLLQNCLELLDEDKFPHIATSAHFMLSDLYIPDDVDLYSPEFVRAEEGKGSSSSPSAASSTDSMGKENVWITKVENLRKANFYEMVSENCKPPPPITSNLMERCRFVLSHTVDGIESLDILCQRREESEEIRRKEQEWRERDNLKMSKPNEPIPMPYDDGNNERSKVQVYNRTRWNSESAVETIKNEISQSQISLHDHLKFLHFKKAFIAYYFMAEDEFRKERFGSALRLVKRALNCYQMLKALRRDWEDKTLVLSMAFSNASDCYMAIVKTWDKLVTFQEQYNEVPEVESPDAKIVDHIERSVDENSREWLIKLPRDMEEALVLSYKCLKQALQLADSCTKTKDTKEYLSMVHRLGNVNNEIGSLYLNQAKSLQLQQAHGGQVPQLMLDLLEKSRVHLEDGIENFEYTGDRANQAFLNANCGHLCRIMADAKGSDLKMFTKEEEFLHKRASDHYERGLRALGKKKHFPHVWDSLQWELSSTYFNLGDRVHNNTPVTLRPFDEVQKLTVAYYTKSLKHLDLDSHKNSPNLPKFQYRAANIHHRLASIQHYQVISDEDDHSKKNFNLKIAELHYGKAAKLFWEIDHYNDYITCLGKRANVLEVFLKDSPNAKLFSSVLGLYVECLPALKEIEKDPSLLQSDEVPVGGLSMSELLGFVLKSVQERLLELCKFLKSKSSRSGSGSVKRDDWAKELYGKSLACDKKSPQFITQFISLLEEVGGNLEKIK